MRALAAAGGLGVFATRCCGRDDGRTPTARGADIARRETDDSGRDDSGRGVEFLLERVGLKRGISFFTQSASSLSPSSSPASSSSVDSSASDSPTILSTHRVTQLKGTHQNLHLLVMMHPHHPAAVHCTQSQLEATAQENASPL